MSLGHVLVGVGLGLDVLGTLFISLDAYRGQKQTAAIYRLLAFITGYEASEYRSRPIEAATEAAVAEATRRAAPSENPAVKTTMEELEKFNEMAAIMGEAVPAATANNKEHLKQMLEDVDTEFAGRKLIIWAAICTVFIGGVLEFVGGVFY
jgi:hypothetical protein